MNGVIFFFICRVIVKLVMQLFELLYFGIFSLCSYVSTHLFVRLIDWLLACLLVCLFVALFAGLFEGVFVCEFVSL